MAALGGADQPGLAEQIQLLREQNNLLVQQNLQLQQGRPAARVQPQPERRRFLEPPTEADLDEQRLYLIPATLTRGPNSHRLPTDVAGAQGEPHLLNLTSEYIYLHAVEKGKKHDSTVLRILLSLLSYLLGTALTTVSLQPPEGRVYTARSLRSGGASAAEMVPLPRSKIEFLGGWAEPRAPSPEPARTERANRVRCDAARRTCELSTRLAPCTLHQAPSTELARAERAD